MLLAHLRQGAGPPLLLIHGSGSRRQVWEPVLPVVSREREAIAVDLPGFGESAPLEGPVSIEAHTRALASFLDDLGLERPHVAGNSLGGWLALELARSGRAASATALSPVGFWTRREHAYASAVLRSATRLARALDPLTPAAARSPATRTLFGALITARPWEIPPDDFVLAVRGLAYAPGMEPALDALRGRRFAASPPIEVPVTIAWGAHDRLLLPRQAARAARMIPGARSVTLERCGHVPTWDDPVAVARVLLEGSAGGPSRAREGADPVAIAELDRP